MATGAYLAWSVAHLAASASPSTWLCNWPLSWSGCASVDRPPVWQICHRGWPFYSPSAWMNQGVPWVTAGAVGCQW